MGSLPLGMRSLGVETVTVVRHEGTDSESRHELECHVQPASGFFAVDADVYEGDVVLVPDPRGGVDRRTVAEVKVFNVGSPPTCATSRSSGAAPQRRESPQSGVWGSKGSTPK